MNSVELSFHVNHKQSQGQKSKLISLSARLNYFKGKNLKLFAFVSKRTSSKYLGNLKVD